MENNTFPALFSTLAIRRLVLKNRIFSTGHQTNMNVDGHPSDRMIAYLAQKAKGGASLVITESSRVHKTSAQPGWVMDVADNSCLDQLSKIASALHEHDCKVFGQLGHPGALCARSLDGIRREVYSASAMRDFRYKNVARPLSHDQIVDITAAYADAAHRYQRAGYDGVEVMASHGVLPAQFLNPNLNQRNDEYGGSLDNRMRFLKGVLLAVRAKVGEDFVIGVRLSLEEKEQGGLTHVESFPVCQVLDSEDLVDYLNITGGTMMSPGGAVHIVPPMGLDTAYLAEDSSSLNKRINKPLFVAGRINQPQMAEQLLKAGVVDMCGMTRAIISDPDMPNKARSGKTEDIIACIACNQACIGHLHLGTPISCIQNPKTGREGEAALLSRPSQSKNVMIVGGGPAGMKAAVTAAERGHSVTLYERSGQLGGQARLAGMLPWSDEFGGLVTNLERQIELAGVEVVKDTEVTGQMVSNIRADTVILATGATPFMPAADLFEGAHVAHAQSVVNGEVNTGPSVVIADWRGDWIGLGVAEKLALDGCSVRLVSEGSSTGEALPNYTRDAWIARCHKLGVEFISHGRIYGANEDTSYFIHALSGEPIILENTDTLVLSTGHSAAVDLEHSLQGLGIEHVVIGDCVSPRSAEEAVYEGWIAGLEV